MRTLEINDRSLIRSVGRIDHVFADLFFKLLPNRLHYLYPLGALGIGQLNEFGTFGIDDLLTIAGGLVGCHFITKEGSFIESLFDFYSDVLWKTRPEFSRGYQQVINQTVIRLGDIILYFKEFLGVDIGPGILLTIDSLGLQRTAF